MENPSFLCLHQRLRTLYAVSEVNSYGGKDTGSVVSWRIDVATGKLTWLGAQATKGRGPCHIAVDQDAPIAMVANYVDGSIVSYRIEPNGALSEPTSFFQHTGGSVDVRRQTAAHAHQIAIMKGASHVVVPDLGSDRLYLYEIDRESASLHPAEPAFVATIPGAGPRHIAFHPNGRFAYLLAELDRTVKTFEINAATCEMRLIASSPLNGRASPTDDLPAEIAMDRCGRFLYCSNRGSDELIVYAVGPDGRIELRQRMACGIKTPRHFAIDPTEDYVFVAGQDSDAVRVLRRNTSTGFLTGTDIWWEVAQPACVAFAYMKPSARSGWTGKTEASCVPQ